MRKIKVANSKSCLVTGAAGFIGSHLAKKLLDEGYSILCIDNFNEYYDPSIKRARKSEIDKKALSLKLDKDSYDFKEIDLRDQNTLENLIESFRPDTICHLAAQAGVRYSLEYPHSYIDNNISAFVNLLEAAKKYKIRDVILASTSSVYGLNKDMPFHEEISIDSTISTYAATKRAGELLCHTYHKLYGINFRILRFFTVYGPWGRPDMALFKFTRKILAKQPIQVYNYGNMKRDFTYIDDIVRGFYLAVENSLPFEIINLGCGNPQDLMKFIEVLEENLGIESMKEMLPMQPGDVESTWADITKAKKLLNYEPQVPIEEGVKNFVNWYKEYFDLLD